MSAAYTSLYVVDRLGQGHACKVTLQSADPPGFRVFLFNFV